MPTPNLIGRIYSVAISQQHNHVATTHTIATTTSLRALKSPPMTSTTGVVLGTVRAKQAHAHLNITTAA